MLCAVVGLVAIAALGKDITRGGLIDPDASAHVMDGVLIHDWILAGPDAWMKPMPFAMTQYGHYPTLGIGAHYPPGFALVEAAFFLVLGVSATSARICVVFFGVIAACGTYFLVRRFAGRMAATISGVLLVVLPATTLWGRQVMLEIPLMAALVWSAVGFLWYAQRPSHARFAIVCVAALSTILFKQSGVFLICAMAMVITLLAIRGEGRVVHAIASVVIALAALGSVMATMDEACLKTVSGYHTHAPWSYAALSFYPRSLPGLVGWSVLIASVAGAVISLWRRRPVDWFLFAWMFVGLVMVSVTSLKTPRFAYLLVLPLVLWAAMAVEVVVNRIPVVKFRPVAIALIVAFAAWAGFRRPVVDGPDFGALVETNRANIEDQVVLFSGLRDGDFVFAVREHVPWRSTVIIRGSKLFYTCTAGPNLDLVSYVEGPEGVAETMRRFAFAQVYVERENRVGTPQDDWLREYLHGSGDYALAGSVLVDGVEGSCGPKVYVDRYMLVRPWQRQVDHFDIPIPRTNRSIRVDLRDGQRSGSPS